MNCLKATTSRFLFGRNFPIIRKVLENGFQKKNFFFQEKFTLPKLKSTFSDERRIKVLSSEGLIKKTEIAIKNHPPFAQWDIKKYGLDINTSQGFEKLAKIAKSGAKNYQFGYFSSEIESFGLNSETIEGETLLLEIAEIAFENYPDDFKNFEKYQINPQTPKGKTALFKMVMKLAERDAKVVNQNIQKIPCDPNSKEDQKHLIEIAKIVAQKGVLEILISIKKYRININTPQGYEGLCQIAKLLTGSLFGTGYYNLSRHIQNFEFPSNTEEERAFLIELAKMAAKNQGPSVLKYIQNYGINPQTCEGHAAFIEIAKLALVYNPSSVEFLLNYGDLSETELIEILKYGVQNSEHLTPNILYLCPFKFNTTALRNEFFEIVKIIAKERPMIVAYEFNKLLDKLDLKTFDFINYQKVLIEIFKICFNLADIQPSRIHYFQISPNSIMGQEVLIDYSLKYYERNGLYGFIKIKESNILNFKIYEKLKPKFCALVFSALICTVQKKELFPDCIEKMLNILNDCDLLLFSHIFELFLSKNPQIEELKNDLDSVSQQYFQCSLSDFGMMDQAHHLEIKEENWKNRQTIEFCHLSFVAQVMADLMIKNIKLQELAIYFPIVKMELRLRNPQLRQEIWKFFLSNQDQPNFIQACACSHQDSKHSILPHIFLAFLKIKGMDITQISKSIKRLKSKKSFVFSEAELNKLLLQTLKELCLEQKFTIEEKQILLEKALGCYSEKKWEKKQIEKALQLIKGIILFGKQKELEITPSLEQEVFIQKLNEVYLSQLIALMPQDDDMKNFCEKMEKAFGKFREQPHSLLRYVSTLNSHKDIGEKKELHSSIASLIKNVLNDQFFKLRYESVHLNIVFDGREKLKKEWQKGKEFLLDKFINEMKKDSNKTYPGWKIMDSDNLGDLFLSGTDIKGSCLRIDADTRNSKCLPAYVMDGKNRLLAITDSKGKIQARAFLRLLWDGEEKKPVLFLERIYPFSLPKNLYSLLVDFAIYRSKSLELPLTSVEIGTGEKYPHELISMGCKAPFEHVDARGLGITNGKFTLLNVHYVE